MLNVLLIDDSMVIRKMLRRTLSDANLEITEVFEAGDGSQALSLLATTQIHMILCDVNMPVMGGARVSGEPARPAGARHDPGADGDHRRWSGERNEGGCTGRTRLYPQAVYAGRDQAEDD